jgi:hypothetical protein
MSHPVVATVSRHTGLSEKDILIWGGLGVLAFVIYKGGLPAALQSIFKTAGESAVSAAGGAVTGVVGGIGDQFGLPTPSQTTTDPAVARWIMDDPRGGYRLASMWASAVAFAEALAMPSGSGTPPPANSAVAQRFPPYVDMGTGGATGGW